jgi:hypothetical protein
MNYANPIKTARIIRTISLICLSLFMLFSRAESPPKDHANKSIGWGSHGMAVFGGHEGLYASHLPMFHAPHDTQVIIRFHLQDQSIDTELRHTLAQKPELWTLDPEEFDLLRLAPDHKDPLKQFTARFVQGHFERGGIERFTRQTAIVDEVILFRRLLATERKLTKGRYHVIGKGSERFLIKEIDRRPDFDLIVALKSSGTLSDRFPTIITLPSHDMYPPSEASWRETLRTQAGSGVSVKSTLYFETEDLK